MSTRHIVLALGVSLVLAASAARAQSSCPSSSIQMGNLPAFLDSAAVLDVTISDPYGSGRTAINHRTAHHLLTVQTNYCCAISNRSVRDRFRLVWPGHSESVRIYLVLDYVVNLFGSNEGDQMSGTLNFSSTHTTPVNGFWVTNTGPGCPPYPNTCNVVRSERVILPITTVPGESIETTLQFRTSYDFGLSGSGAFVADLRFTGLPPGSSVMSCSGDTMRTVSGIVDVESDVSGGVTIDRVWPNPARGEIRVAFRLPQGPAATMQLVDAAGRLVEHCVLESGAVGRREIALGGRLAPGTYFLKATQGESKATKVITILR